MTSDMDESCQLNQGKVMVKSEYLMSNKTYGEHTKHRGSSHDCHRGVHRRSHQSKISAFACKFEHIPSDTR